MYCETCDSKITKNLVVMGDGRVCCYACGRLEAERDLRTKSTRYTKGGGYLGEGNYRAAMLARTKLRARAIRREPAVSTPQMQALREARC